MPDGLSAQVALADQLKRKKLFEAMANSVQPPEQPATLPMAGGVNLPAPSPAMNVPSGLPDATASPYKPPPVRIHIGADTGGLQGIDKSIAELGTERQAAKEFPSSKVVNGEIKAPKMHGGFKDTLKSIGKGLVINMGEYARTHPGAELPELLGAGGAGAAVGGISPISIDQQIANAAVQKHEGELGRQIGLEQEQGQLAGIKLKPVLEAERIRTEQQKAAEQARLEDERMRETARHNQATEAASANRAVRRPERRTVGNKVVEIGDDGQAKVVYEGEPKSDETPKDIATRTRNFNAARSKYEGLIEEEKAAAKAKDDAFEAYHQATKRYPENADIQPDVIAAKAEADKAQEKYASYWGKKDAAKAEMIQHGDGVDDKGEPLPPKMMRGQQGTPTPTSHVLSKSAWLKSHPETDWPKAVAAAKAAGYQIVQ